MTEKNNPRNLFVIKLYTLEYYVKFSFWVRVLKQSKRQPLQQWLEQLTHIRVIDGSIPTKHFFSSFFPRFFFGALRPGQQMFSIFGTISCFHRLNQ